MKRASETNEVEVLDSAFFRSGGELGWSVFGSERMTPAEILEEREAGEDDPGLRAAVMGLMVSVCLEGWAREVDVEAVGRRVYSLARTVRHSSGFGFGVPVMRGILEAMGGESGAEVARRVLDLWMWDEPDFVAAGKRLLAFGLFFNHAEMEGWSVRQVARAVGESRTWMSKRVRRECNAPIERAGGSARASWQQGEAQRKRTAAMATGRKRK